jgi:hypothetical protein
VGHHGIGVRVLGVEIGDDLGVGSLLQPVVVVDSSLSELLQSFRPADTLIPKRASNTVFQRFIRDLPAFVD